MGCSNSAAAAVNRREPLSSLSFLFIYYYYCIIYWLHYKNGSIEVKLSKRSFKVRLNYYKRGLIVIYIILQKSKSFDTYFKGLIEINLSEML